MNRIKSKNSKIVVLIITIASLLAIIGVSLAYFFADATSSENKLASTFIEVMFEEGDEKIDVMGIPLTDDEIDEYASYMLFSVTNTGDAVMYTDLYIDDIVVSSDALFSEDFRWEIDQGSGLSLDTFGTPNRIATGDFSVVDKTSSSINTLAASNIKLEVGETRYYKLKVWLSENNGDQNAFLNQTASVSVSAKGYVASGTYIAGENINISNSNSNDKIAGLKLYGNSTNNSGGTSKNLFNEALLELEKTDEGYVCGNYPKTYGSGSALITHLKRVLEPNVTYTLSRDVTGYTGTSSGMIWIRNASGNLVQTSYGNGVKKVTFSLTQEQIDSINSVYVYGHSKSPITFKYIQLEKGSSATEYVPYESISPTNPVEIESVGDYNETTNKYEIPITVGGKNLFDANTMYTGKVNPNVKFEILDNGYFKITRTRTDWTAGAVFKIHLKAGTYVLSAKVISRNFETTNWFIYSSTLGKPINGTEGSFTFTLDEEQDVKFQCNLNDTVTDIDNEIIANVQIEKGSTATTYEPYVEPITHTISLDEPLKRVGTYSDYIDFESGKVVRNVGKKYFEDMNYTKHNVALSNGGYRAGYFNPTIMKAGKDIPVPGLSNVLIVNNGSWAVGYSETFRLGQNNGMIYAYTNSAYDDKEALINYLSNNNSVEPYIMFPLATPTEERINVPNIKAIDGTTIITVDTDVKGTLEYISR